MADGERQSPVRNDSETHRHMAENGLQKTDSNCVEWSKDHHEYPRNWSMRRKLYDTSVIAFLSFYTTTISTTGPSAAMGAMKDYGLSRVISLVGFSFMYNAGQAIGGLLMPPFSESFGRRKPYLYSSAAYVIGSLLTSEVPHAAGPFVGRFICGFASGIPSIVFAGSIEDMYPSKQRVWLLTFWSSVSTLGVCIGPIYGSYIEDVLGWRWIYRTCAITVAVVFFLALGICESRPTKRLAIKLAQLPGDIGKDLQIHNPDHIPHARAFFQAVVLRPLQLAFTEPIVILVTILNGASWGLISLFTTSMSVVYGSFGWSERATSLSFVAIALGIPLSILPRFWDLRKMRQCRERGESPKPEDKIIGFAFAAPALAIGLWLFSWTVPPLVHVRWIVSLVGLVLVGFATNEFAYDLEGYLADAYTAYASSGLAAVSSIRAFVAATTPLFGQQMFKGLGANVAGSILAALATVFCITPVVFLRYGKTLRERSKFARYSVKVNEEHGDD